MNKRSSDLFLDFVFFSFFSDFFFFSDGLGQHKQRGAQMRSDTRERPCTFPFITMRDLLALAAGALFAFSFGPSWSSPDLRTGSVGVGLGSAREAHCSTPSPPPGWKYTATYNGAIVDPRLGNTRWASQCGQYGTFLVARRVATS